MFVIVRGRIPVAVCRTPVRAFELRATLERLTEYEYRIFEIALGKELGRRGGTFAGRAASHA